MCRGVLKTGRPLNPVLAHPGVDRIEVPDWRRGASAAARTARGLAPVSASNSFSCPWETPRQNGSGRKFVLPAITESTTEADASRLRSRRRERVRAAPRPSKAPDSAPAPGIGPGARERMNPSDSCCFSRGPAPLTRVHDKECKSLARQYIRSNY
jgi:hypothetical protein